MSAVLLHGVAHAALPAPSEAPDHLRVEAGDLVALASPMEAAALGPDDLLRHHRLLSAQVASGTVAPVRFGTAFSDAAALRSAIGQSAGAYRATLAQLDGRVEYALRAEAVGAPPTPPEPEPETGRAFLQRRAAGRAARRAQGDAERAALAELAAAVAGVALQVQQAARRPGRPLDLAVLVARTQSAGLARIAAEAAVALTPHGLRLCLLGPLPCYSFLPEAA